MKVIFLFLMFIPFKGISQEHYVIETADIDHFWSAYDRLITARTKTDSIQVIQEGYIDRATDYFKVFLKARDFTAVEYVVLINKYPEFWKSIRPLMENISNRKSEIEKVFAQLGATLPGFKYPNVCFAVGCLRTGGTTSSNLILIGAEIAAADTSVNKTGMSSWLQSVLGKTGDIVSMVAHEAVHTQQSGIPFLEIFRLISHRKLTLLNMAILEGSADFITVEILGLNINAAIHTYGEAHECALWREFEEDCGAHPFDYSTWLYNGTTSVGRPADLAYYVGCKVTESYYVLQENKEKALKTILKRGRYKRVVKRSNYAILHCP